MRRRNRGHLLRAVSALILLLSATCPALLAQNALQPPPTTPGPQAVDELTVEAVQSLKKQLAERTDIVEDVRQQALQLYDSAIEQLTGAQTAVAAAGQFEAAVREAPALLGAIREELGIPAAEPVIEIPPDASLAQLEQMLAQAEARFSAAQKEAADLDAEFQRRTQRRNDVPREAAAAQQRLADILREISTPLPVEEGAAVSEARRILQSARKKAVEQQLRAYEKEIESYVARGDLITARRDRAARNVVAAEKVAKAMRGKVAERRREDTVAAAREAEAARRALAEAHPTVRALADENARLATRRRELAPRLDDTSAQRDAARKKLEEVSSAFESIRKKVDRAGVTQALSILLRKQRAQLPNVRNYQSRRKATAGVISEVQVEGIELEEQRPTLVDLDAEAQKIMHALDPPVIPSEMPDVEAEVRKQLTAKRNYMEPLTEDLDTYFLRLIELDEAEQQLITQTRSFQKYIDENILWFRSTTGVGTDDLTYAWQGLKWLAAPRAWAGAGAALARDALYHPVIYIAALAAFAVLIPLKRRLRLAAAGVSEQVWTASTDSFNHTLVAFLAVLLNAVWLPFMIAFVAARLWSAGEGSEFLRAAAVGLWSLVIVLFTTQLLACTCRQRGLAAVHFRWRHASLALVARHLRWFVPIAVPVGFVVAAISWQQENDLWKEHLGKLALVTGLVSLAVFLQRLLRPSGKLMEEYLRRHRNSWLERLRYLWYPLAVATPASLALASLVGYQYTALQLSTRFVITLWLVIGLVFANSMMLRWIFVAHRRLAMEKALKRRAAQMEARRAALESAEEAPEQIEEPEIDISSISQQTRKIVRLSIAAALIIGLYFIWADILPALGIMDRVKLWPKSQTEYVTLTNLLVAVLVVVITIAAARNIPGLLEIAILQRLPLDHGVRFAISAVARYVITVVGIVIAFAVVGVGWSKVQWLLAAVTVGLGFGLQEIFGNFISGLIILFERPMRVGDTVTVGNVTGTVTRIQIRATTIRDWDRKELIVPNKEFITGQLVNWTLSDAILRVVIPVGIEYGSDTRLAERLLLEAASQNPHVMEDPVSNVLFMGFGDSSLNFELRVFIPSVDYFLVVRHELHMAIDAAFRKAGVVIAFPQRDIHVRSIEGFPPAPQPPRQEQA